MTDLKEEITNDEIEQLANEAVKEAEAPEAPVEPVDDIDDDLPPEPKTNSDFAKYRIKLKEKDTQLKEMQNQLARVQGFVEGKFQQPAQVQEQKQPDPEPDFDVDPKAWALWHKQKTDAELYEVKESFKQERAKSELREIITGQQQKEQLYAKDNPQYEEAKNFLRQKLAQAIKQETPYITQEELNAKILQEEYAALLTARQTGMNPGRYIKSLAEEIGFQPSPVTPPKEKVSFETLKRNQTKTVTLAGAKSNAGKMGEVTDEEYAEMTLAQIAALRRNQ